MAEVARQSGVGPATLYRNFATRRELLESALHGMLQDLDPHSVYINTAQYKTFKRKIEGRFGGLGITVGYDTEANRLKVLAPMVKRIVPDVDASSVISMEDIEALAKSF